MKKRWAIVAIFAAACVLVALAGCGLIGEKYTYIEWYTWYFEKYFPRWFDEFEKRHADENVRIRFRAMTSSVGETVYTMLISDTLSDCIILGAGTNSLLLENDALEPIDLTESQRADVHPVSLKLATDETGLLRGLPLSMGMRPFIYFNRDCLREAGVSADEVPSTFDEYHAWAGRLFKWDIDGGVAFGTPDAIDVARAKMLRRPIAVIRGYDRSAFPILISRMDPSPDENGVSDHSIDDYFGGPPSGRPFRFDTPEFVEGLREYSRFFLPEETAIADGFSNRMPGFLGGRYAGMEGANWIYGEVFTVDIVPSRLPHAPGRPGRVFMNSSAIGVSKRSRKKRLALEFARFITRPEAQLDQYYGHGYLPSAFSAWDMIADNDAVDEKIRREILAGPGLEGRDLVGVPQIKRGAHDDIELLLYLANEKDVTILTAVCGAGGDEAGVSVAENETARGYRRIAADVARRAAELTGEGVKVTVRGTPLDMIPARSYVLESPVPIYLEYLDRGFYVPVSRIWDRLRGEVIVRACQFVTKSDDPKTPEDAARWAQEEAEAILAGRK
ncbi:MAG: extracellular solute-binding protein [Planctomycetota bacterium]|jgi:ABC-type glycerol-3-phosphate transport system substrate-binding protein